MEDYKGEDFKLKKSIKDKINEYFISYGYEEQNFGNGHFEQHYNRYLFGALKDYDPSVIDDWIELERVLGAELSSKQAIDITSHLNRTYDCYVSDLEIFITR